MQGKKENPNRILNMNFKYCYLEAQTFAIFLKALSNNMSLISLNFANNQLMDAKAVSLLGVIEVLIYWNKIESLVSGVPQPWGQWAGKQVCRQACRNSSQERNLAISHNRQKQHCRWWCQTHLLNPEGTQLDLRKSGQDRNVIFLIIKLETNASLASTCRKSQKL